jgi:hypothetical protein
MSEFISLADAVKMTKDYQQRRTNLTNPSLPENTLPICETFESDHVSKLLQKTGCTGIRAYLGLDNNDQVKLVLVAVDEDDNDLYQGTDALLDKAARCPSICPPSSPLND